MLLPKLTAVCDTLSHSTFAGAVYVMQLNFRLEALTAEMLLENIVWMQLNFIYLGTHTDIHIYRHFLSIGFWSVLSFWTVSALSSTQNNSTKYIFIIVATTKPLQNLPCITEPVFWSCTSDMQTYVIVCVILQFHYTNGLHVLDIVLELYDLLLFYLLFSILFFIRKELQKRGSVGQRAFC